MRLSHWLFLSLAAMIPLEAASADPLRLGLAGDSTVCAYPADSAQHGWGELLPEFFDPATVFCNQAQGGRSSKDFPPARWQALLAFKPDFVLIQFGHNDSHAKDRPESTDAATDYKDNLRRYVTEARAAGAVPILVTPPHRRNFDKAGQLTTELAPYVSAMKEVAAELSVPVVDLYAGSGALYASLGEEGSTGYTMNNAGKAPEPDGHSTPGDRTHFNTTGAREMARIVADGLAKADPRFQAALRSPVPVASAPAP